MTPPAAIRIIDIETTGMEPPEAEVVELGLCDLMRVDGELVVGAPASWLFGVRAIPPEVRAVHHISMQDVQGALPFDRDAFINKTALECVAIAAHNLEFEQKFFRYEGRALCTYKAALRMFPNAPSHSNGVLRYWLEEQELIKLDHETAMPPHRAGPDAYVTAHILKALIDAGTTVSQMLQWSAEPPLLPRCTIGKFRGFAWPDVEIGFLQWMTRQPDMDAGLVWNARRELDRRRAA